MATYAKQGVSNSTTKKQAHFLRDEKQQQQQQQQRSGATEFPFVRKQGSSGMEKAGVVNFANSRATSASQGFLNEESPFSGGSTTTTNMMASWRRPSASLSNLELMEEEEEEEEEDDDDDEEAYTDDEDEDEEEEEEEEDENSVVVLDAAAAENDIQQSKQDDGANSVSFSMSDVLDPKTVLEQTQQKSQFATPVFATEDFESVYQLGKELGKGTQAVVKEGTHRQTGETYAIKIIDTEQLTQENLEALHVEISIMSELNHPNILRLYETYVQRNKYCLVIEQMMGGELLDRVVKKEFYNEKEARDTCSVLFSAIRHCHSRNIAHRDLKPENLLLQSNDSDSNLKIADFGYARKVPPDGLRTLCGTPGYLAPEILERTPYGFQCDMWSLGVIVYILLGGYSPFEEETQDLLFEKVRLGAYEFHAAFWDPISGDAKDLIGRLLTVNPRARWTAEQALQHPWMARLDADLENTDLIVNLTELKRFNAKRKFRAAVKTVIATQKLTSRFGHR